MCRSQRARDYSAGLRCGTLRWCLGAPLSGWMGWSDVDVTRRRWPGGESMSVRRRRLAVGEWLAGRVEADVGAWSRSLGGNCLRSDVGERKTASCRCSSQSRRTDSLGGPGAGEEERVGGGLSWNREARARAEREGEEWRHSGATGKHTSLPRRATPAATLEPGHLGALEPGKLGRPALHLDIRGPARRPLDTQAQARRSTAQPLNRPRGLPARALPSASQAKLMPSDGR